MPDDAPEPAGKGRRLGERGQCGPGGHEGFLNDVLRLLEVTHQRKGRTERKVLEATRQIDEGADVALACPANQLFVIHRHALSPQRCRERQPTFRKKQKKQ
jgi:hypothetical protein